MKNTLNFVPVLADSQLKFRIRLAEKRLGRYPLDSLDFIMMDLEHPKKKSRHADQCTTDLTGRTIEFLSAAHQLIPESDDTRLNELFHRSMLTIPEAGMIRRIAAYYQYTNDSEAYAHLIETGEKWLAAWDKAQTEEEKAKIGVHSTCDSEVEPLAFLYSLTGDIRYLELSRHIGKVTLDSFPPNYCHSHGYMTVLRSLQKAAILSGDDSLNDLVNPRRQKILDEKMPYADGSVSEGFPKSRRTEGCSIADWIILNLQYGFLYDDPEAYDLAEHSLYNGLYFNQFVTGGFGHRDYMYRGYGTIIEEAWWCCTQTAGLAMCQFARHAVQLTEGKIRVNYLIPGTYTLKTPEQDIKVTVSTTFPEDFKASIVVESREEYELDLRIPSYAKKVSVQKKAWPNGRTTYQISGRLGFYLEKREDGYCLKYGPMLLAPMIYNWMSSPTPLLDTEKDVPEGYIRTSFEEGNCYLDLPQPDEDGFYDLSIGDKMPVWSVFDDGTGSHIGTHKKAMALVPVRLGERKDTLFFHPISYATSNLTLNNIVMVFDKA